MIRPIFIRIAIAAAIAPASVGAQPTVCLIPRPSCDLVAVTDAGVELGALSTHHSGKARDIGERFSATVGVAKVVGPRSYGLSSSWLADGGGSGSRFELRYRRSFLPTGEIGGNIGYESWEIGTGGTSVIRRQTSKGFTTSAQLDYRWAGIDARVSLLHAPAGPVRALSLGVRLRERAAWTAATLYGLYWGLLFTHPPD